MITAVAAEIDRCAWSAATDRSTEPWGSGLAFGAQAALPAFDDVVNVVLDRLSALGWTREELATRAGLNVASLRRLLTISSANPTFATMSSVAEVLGVRIEIREAAWVEQMRAAE